jgi:hypothetical protein
MATGPITDLLQPQQQHMLLLFLPLKSGNAETARASIGKSLESMGQPSQPNQKTEPGPDSRPSTGVHFFMFYTMAACTPSPIVVPTFQAAPGVPGGKARDLAVVLSIYDADFEPYIGSFFANPNTVNQLNAILTLVDEEGLVAADDPSSAANILANGGVRKNASAFYQFLMRYNFADPTIPAIGPGGMANPLPAPRYLLGATFPGLTVGKILDAKAGYPEAALLWPSPDATPAPPAITYEPSVPPSA